MKKLMTLLTLATVFSTNAATTGTLLLQGVVTKKLSITVTANAQASSLDLTQSKTDLVVASVNEKSNSNTGYKVNVKSSNLGNLKRSGGTEVVSYSLKYGSSTVDLSTTTGQTFNNAGAAVANVNKDVKISYTGIAEESLVEGTYADTVTFEISAI